MALSLRRSVSDLLVDRGLDRSGRTLRRPLAAEFHLIVDTGPLTGGPDVSPWVGLQYTAAARIQAALLELAFDDFVATVGANIGVVLQRDYLSWQSLDDVAEVLDTIDAGADRLREFAHPTASPRRSPFPGSSRPTPWQWCRSTSPVATSRSWITGWPRVHAASARNLAPYAISSDDSSGTHASG